MARTGEPKYWAPKDACYKHSPGRLRTTCTPRYTMSFFSHPHHSSEAHRQTHARTCQLHPNPVHQRGTQTDTHTHLPASSQPHASARHTADTRTHLSASSQPHASVRHTNSRMHAPVSFIPTPYIAVPLWEHSAAARAIPSDPVRLNLTLRADTGTVTLNKVLAPEEAMVLKA